jgi:aspartate aminotransferase-like enzyme
MSRDEPLLLLAGPTTVSHDVLHSMIKPVIGHRGNGFHELMSSIEEKLKTVFGTKNPVVVVTASGTGGIEASLVSFLRRGEKLVVPVYGAFGDRLASAAASLGIDVARYEIDCVI